MKELRSLWSSEAAQAVPEYGLLVGAVVVMVVVLSALFGGSLDDLFVSVSTQITNAAASL